MKLNILAINVEKLTQNFNMPNTRKDTILDNLVASVTLLFLIGLFIAETVPDGIGMFLLVIVIVGIVVLIKELK